MNGCLPVCDCGATLRARRLSGSHDADNGVGSLAYGRRREGEPTKCASCPEEIYINANSSTPFAEVC